MESKNLRIILKREITNKDVSLEYLASKYKIKELEILGFVNDWVTHGDNIHVYQKDRKIYVRNFGDKKLNDSQAFKITSDKRDLKFLLISDTRIGSIFQQLSILEDVYTRAAAEGVDYVLHCGDIVEGEFKGKDAVLNQTLFVSGLRGQSNYVAKVFPQIEGVKTYFITGERDTSLTNKNNGYRNVGMEISSRRKDIVHLGERSRKVSFVNTKNNNEFSIFMLHKEGKTPYTVSYPAQNDIYSTRNEDKTDLVTSGHGLVFDKLFYQNIHYYQIPSLVAKTTEMKQKKAKHNEVGAWIITVERNKDLNIEDIYQKAINYDTTLTDDYKKQKRLVLTRGGRR